MRTPREQTPIIPEKSIIRLILTVLKMQQFFSISALINSFIPPNKQKDVRKLPYGFFRTTGVTIERLFDIILNYAVNFQDSS